MLLQSAVTFATSAKDRTCSRDPEPDARIDLAQTKLNPAQSNLPLNKMVPMSRQGGEGGGPVGPALPAGVCASGRAGPGVRHQADRGGRAAARRRPRVQAGGRQARPCNVKMHGNRGSVADSTLWLGGGMSPSDQQSTNVTWSQPHTVPYSHRSHVVYLMARAA